MRVWRLLSHAALLFVYYVAHDFIQVVPHSRHKLMGGTGTCLAADLVCAPMDDDVS